MAERKYSIHELDRMRSALHRRRGTNDTLFVNRDEQRAHWDAADVWVENQLRTYMLNGTEPDELDAAADLPVSR